MVRGYEGIAIALLRAKVAGKWKLTPYCEDSTGTIFCGEEWGMDHPIRLVENIMENPFFKD